MSSSIASHAAVPIHALAESLHLTEAPHPADATVAEPLTEFHPHAGNQEPSTTEGTLSWGGVVAQLYALELERRGIKLNLEQTAVKMGVEMPPKDCAGK